MRNHVVRFVSFLVLNFTALAIGGIFTGKGVPSDWYADLDKAPWTPEGWAFGFAWTTIMICFSIYLTQLWPLVADKKHLAVSYSIQWFLNVGWNPAFFYFHNVTTALFIISGLTLLVGYLFFHYWPDLRLKSVWIIPYFLWLIIATSLNGFIELYN